MRQEDLPSDDFIYQVIEQHLLPTLASLEQDSDLWEDEDEWDEYISAVIPFSAGVRLVCPTGLRALGHVREPRPGCEIRVRFFALFGANRYRWVISCMFDRPDVPNLPVVIDVKGRGELVRGNLVFEDRGLLYSGRNCFADECTAPPNSTEYGAHDLRVWIPEP